MRRSPDINELAAALARAQAAMRPAEKDGQNPVFRSRFATLASIWDACRGPLTDNGLAVVQAPLVAEEGGFVLATTLFHASGQWVESRLPLPPEVPNAQSLGSAITYMRRYGLAAMVGVVADDDDDGEAAAGPPRHRPEPIRRPAPAAPRPDPMPAREEVDPEAEFRRYIDRAVGNWEKFEPFGPTESRRARELRLANHVVTAAIEAGLVAEAAVWKPGTQVRSPGAAWEAVQFLHREHRGWLMGETLRYLREKSAEAKAPAAEPEAPAAEPEAAVATPDAGEG